MDSVSSITSRGTQYEIEDELARERKLDKTDLPKNISYFLNDSGYINRAVQDLLNYYKKSEVYSKTEINTLLSARVTFKFVDALPTENISPSSIYFVPRSQSQTDNIYNEYVYVEGETNRWEFIGSTVINPDDYYTKAETSNLIDSKIETESAIRQNEETALGARIDTVQGNLNTTNNNLAAEETARRAADLRQEETINALSQSVSEENNRALYEEAILSGRADNAEAHIADTANPHGVTKTQVGLGNVENLATDATPTLNSPNNVSSGGVFDALATKVDKVTGKGLSDQNFTYAEKTKLAGLQNYDDTAITGRMTAAESAINTLNGNSSTAGSVDYKIYNAIKDINSFDFEVVESLPQTGRSNVVYFVLNGTVETGTNIYDEYVWLNNKWELLTITKVVVDLSDYYTKSQTNALVSAKNDKITVTNDTSALTDTDSFDETPAGANPTATKRRLLSSLWTYIKGKVTGGASSIMDSNLTASRALVSDANGKVAVSGTSSTELEYVKGVTSAIQTQLNGKVPNTRTVNGHALSDNVSVTKSDIGLGNVANIDQSKAIKSITRSGATFTATALDGSTTTFTQQDSYVTQQNTATNSYRRILLSGAANDTNENGTVRKCAKLTGNPSTGDLKAVMLNGVTIGDSPKFTDTTYSNATTSSDGLMSATDKTKLDGIETGAQVNTITGVKGDSETAYRTGNVNITPANIGLGNVNNTADSNKAVASAGKLTTARKVYVKLGTASTTETKDFGGDTAIPVNGTLGVANGGTGKTTLVDSANALINSLSTKDSDPQDDDYYVAQYAGGGTSTTTFHRRPISKLWNYIKGKLSATNSGSGNAITALSYANGVFTAIKGSTFLTSHQDITGKTNLTVVAPTFSTSTAYAVGNFVVYNQNLYKCTTAHSAGSWNADHFTQVTVMASITKDTVGLGNVGNFKAVSTVASQGLTATEKSNARANIGAGTSSFSGSYTDLTNKPTIPSAVTVDSALSTTSTNPVQNKVINTALSNKVDKVTGKGLSTNDFTTALKNKLEGIDGSTGGITFEIV